MSRSWDAFNRVPLCFGAFRPTQGLFVLLEIPVHKDRLAFEQALAHCLPARGETSISFFFPSVA